MAHVLQTEESRAWKFLVLQKQTRRGPKIHCANCDYATEPESDDAPELPEEPAGAEGEESAA